MTKAELIEAVAEGAKISKTAAAKAIDSMINGIKNHLKKATRLLLSVLALFLPLKEKQEKGAIRGQAKKLKFLQQRFPSLYQARRLRLL